MNSSDIEIKIPKRIFCFWHDHSSIPSQVQKMLNNTFKTHQDNCEVIFADDRYIINLLDMKENLLWGGVV